MSQRRIRKLWAEGVLIWLRRFLSRREKDSLMKLLNSLGKPKKNSLLICSRK